MAARPEELRAEIAATREDLGTTLDAIGDRVSPGRMVERRRAAVRERFVTVRNRVMGTTGTARYRAGTAASGVGGTVSSAAGTVGGTVSSAASTVGDVASSAAGTVAQAPDMAMRTTEGNPLVAGALAFGVGFLVASVLPESEMEQQAASTVQEKMEPVKEQVTEAAQQVAATAKETAQQAVEETKVAATDAASQVKDQAAQASQEVKEHATDAASQVRDEASTTTQQYRSQ